MTLEYLSFRQDIRWLILRQEKMRCLFFGNGADLFLNEAKRR